MLRQPQPRNWAQWVAQRALQRKQLHLFASTDGSSFLIQLRRLGAYLQAGLLVARAFRDPRVSLVLAETMPARVASQKVLARCGFTHVGGYFDPEQGQIMRFEMRRPG